MRDHILKVVNELFYQQGIRSVGMDRVIAEAGIAKATLYRHFPTKTLLVQAYLKQRHQAILQSMEQLLENSTKADAKTRIANIFAWIGSRVESGTFRGCAFLLALGEYGHEPEVRELVRAHKKAMKNVFAAALGEPLLQYQPDLVRHIAYIYDGAVASATVSGSAVDIEVALQLALTLIAAQES